MLRCPRKPAIAILLLFAALAAGYLWKSGLPGGPGGGRSLAALEVAVASPDAGTEIWLQYGQRLSEVGRFEHAVAAFGRVLEKDPYSRSANMGCAAAFARSGSADRLYDFTRGLMAIEPRLILDILGRPESAPYRGEKRFKELYADALAQSMD